MYSYRYFKIKKIPGDGEFYEVLNGALLDPLRNQRKFFDRGCFSVVIVAVEFLFPFQL